MPYRVGLLLVLLSCAGAFPSRAQSLVTTIPVSGFPYGVAVNPGNNRIYVSLSTAVDVIDGATNTVIDTVQTPQGSTVIAANMVTGRVYTAGCATTCGVTVIDGTTDTVIATIPVKGSSGIGVEGIAVNPVTNRVYVSDNLIYEVEEIDGNSNTVLTYIKTDRTEMLALAVDFSTDQILGAASGEAMIVINGANNAVSRIKVGTINWGMAANSFTSRAYVTNNVGNTLGVVNLVNSKVVANVPVGSAPFEVCVDYLSNKIFVTNTGDGTVAVVDGKTNTKIGSVSANSNYIDVNPVTRMVYTSSTYGNMINVISE